MAFIMRGAAETGRCTAFQIETLLLETATAVTSSRRPACDHQCLGARPHEAWHLSLGLKEAWPCPYAARSIGSRRYLSSVASS